MTRIEQTAQTRRRALADDLHARSVIGQDWHRVFATVPRHVFVPRVHHNTTVDGEFRTEVIDASDPDRWLELVYSDRLLLIRPDVTSSSTIPSLMAKMLHALDPRPGDRVLEIGTGSGYNVALLCERVGDEQVVTIDIDPELVEDARERLASAGYRPVVATASGNDGYPGTGPYDRLIATCAVHTVPRAWLDQVRPGGRIVAPIGAGIARILNEGAGNAAGRFLPDPAYFMPLRANATQPDLSVVATAARNATGEQRRCTHPPEIYYDTDAGFVLGLALPGIMRTREDGTLILWHADGSWARVRPHSVVQAGPRRLWDEIESTYDTWMRLGKPGRDRYGITIIPGSQHVWLDQPEAVQLEL